MLFKVLETIVDNKENVVVTEQIINEVFRNSVKVSTENLTNTLKSLEWKKPTLPYKNAQESTITLINNVFTEFTTMKKQIENDLDSHLNLVSEQNDEVSLKLKELFENALSPTDEEISLAEQAKKFGNPPGKHNDPIGDEISWVQLLNKTNTADKVIIITNDRDYANGFNGLLYLNSLLHHQLKEKKVEYYIFSDVNTGLKKYIELQEVDNIPLEQKDIPTKEEFIEIEKEERSIMSKDAFNQCKHDRKTFIQNGIYDDWICLDCNKILHRQFGEID